MHQFLYIMFVKLIANSKSTIICKQLIFDDKGVAVTITDNNRCCHLVADYCTMRLRAVTEELLVGFLVEQ